MEKVSAIITTLGNFKYLERAINSVISQESPVFEIIVVIDGYEAETEKKLNKCFGNKVKVHQTGVRRGGGFARNFGIKKASGEWLALLDDDDEWEVEKIANQIRAVEDYTVSDNLFVFTALRTVGGKKEVILPNIPWDNTMDVATYLFKPYRAKVSGYIQTSTLFASKKFFLKNPFNESLPKHQDWDWAINTQKFENMTILFINKPLTKYYQQNLGSVGKINRWKFSLRWIESRSNLIDQQAIDYFIITNIIPNIILDNHLGKKEKYLRIKKLLSKINKKNLINSGIFYWVKAAINSIR